VDVLDLASKPNEKVYYVRICFELMHLVDIDGSVHPNVEAADGNKDDVHEDWDENGS
jgi:hypothetical protein